MVRGSLPDIAVTMASGREIHGSFSFIVDDVDSQRILSDSPDVVDATCEANARNSAARAAGAADEGPRERIKQMQDEAETRRGEFARLLEEHAQVVRKLKMMEAEEQLSMTAEGGVVAGSHA